MSPTIRNQATLAGIALAAGLALTALGSGTALAASPAVEQCRADGCEYVKEGSTAFCDCPAVKVSSPNANPDNNAQTTEKDQTGQGNLNNKEQIICDGPPGKQDPACP